MSKAPEGTIAFGKFLKPFGIGGELKFHPYLPDEIGSQELKGGYLVPPSKEEGQKIELLSAREAGKQWVVHPQGVNSPEEASKLTNKELWIDRSLLPDLPEGQYLHLDLIGCKVVDEKEIEIGSIKGIMQTGANDVWEIARTDGGELLLPAIQNVIREVDIKNKKVVIRLLEGLGDI